MRPSAMAPFPSPLSGDPITHAKGRLEVPKHPIIPFVEGDGTGPDIWRASQRVLDAAVAKAYGGKRAVASYEVFAGEKAFSRFGQWLPDETVAAYRGFLVGIKGPLTTPIGKGIRSLNVALRQLLDLYVCLRPVRWFRGTPSPVRDPSKVDMVIFRENTEDIYAGIEWEAESADAKKVVEFLRKEMLVKNIRFPETSGIGIKAVSREGTERLVRAAIQYALREKRKSVTLVHKGNIMKFTEGAFRDWGYALATCEFRDRVVTEREYLDPGQRREEPSITVEQNAKEIEPGYDVAPAQVQWELRDEVAEALKLLHDSRKRRVAEHVAGQGRHRRHHTAAGPHSSLRIRRDRDAESQRRLLVRRTRRSGGRHRHCPGANINYATGHAIFEATHGTAPKYANLDKVNPGSVILSGEMMLLYIGWIDAANLVLKGMDGAIAAKTVTYDFARQMEGATELRCSGFADAVISHMR